MKHLFLILALCVTINASAQKKEVLIIGVMYSLPEVVRTSYLPLLRIAKEYQPQAIYVESVPPSDQKSWDVILEKGKGEMYDFWKIHTDLQQVASSQPVAFNKNDYGRAVGYFQLIGDYANTIFYLYKINGVPKHALGDEFYDLSLPLATAMGIDSLRSFDCRIYDKEYYDAMQHEALRWQQNGNAEAYAKLFDKDYNDSKMPAMFGTYALHYNKEKVLQRAHDFKSFNFAVDRNHAVKEIDSLWRMKNEAMAQIIGSQIIDNQAQRSVVVVGNGQVVGIREALKNKFPEIEVKTIDNLKN